MFAKADTKKTSSVLQSVEVPEGFMLIEKQPNVSLFPLERKEETKLPSAKLRTASSKMAGSVTLEFSTQTPVAYIAGSAAGVLSWDPTGVADFAALANLFSDYRVDSLCYEFTTAPVVSTTDWTVFAYAANDPAQRLTTPTQSDLTVASGHKNLLQGLGHSVRFEATPQLGLAASAQPSKGGYLRTNVSWPGQSLYSVESANIASTALAFGLVERWKVTFRSRYA